MSIKFQLLKINIVLLYNIVSRVNNTVVHSKTCKRVDVMLSVLTKTQQHCEKKKSRMQVMGIEQCLFDVSLGPSS